MQNMKLAACTKGFQTTLQYTNQYTSIDVQYTDYLEKIKGKKFVDFEK